ncbi:hypothetical protein GF345_02970 [Candidatus Woesearchaeota archaeon]|nr:hypothetical protein [Candidatus Woesearchaeota archaeon]
MADAAPETNIILPRNYGLVVRQRPLKQGEHFHEDLSGLNLLFYDAARSAIGYVSVLPQSELRKMLRTWQKFKKNETQQAEQGTLGYTPRFSGQSIEDLFFCDWREAEEAILEGIEKKEGTPDLWATGGKNAIKNAKLYRGGLHGRIKSKNEGYHSSFIANPFLSDGKMLHMRLGCSEPGHNYESGAKRLMSMCSHLFGLETAQFLQLTGRRDFGIDYGKKNLKYVDPALVFDFITEEDLSNLVMDVVLARYVQGDSLYDVNRNMHDGEIRDAIFSKGLNDTARAGLVRYGVMRQKSQNNPERGESYQTAENQWLRKVTEKLKELGYAQMPFYSIAFMDGAYEVIASRWENGDKVIEIAADGIDAPLIIRKNLDSDGEIKFHSSPPAYDSNPYLNIGKKQRSFDACSSLDCDERILDPLQLNDFIGISQRMQKAYRGSIARAQRKEMDYKRPRQESLPF